MLNSLAWHYLPSNAKILHIEVLKEWAGGDKNNIKLSYSVIRTRLGFSSPTTSRALIYQEKFGFLKKVHVGGLFKSTSIYGLSQDWQEIKSIRDVEAAAAAAIKEIHARRKRQDQKKEKTLPGNYKYEQKLTREKSRKNAATTLETNSTRLETNPKQG